MRDYLVFAAVFGFFPYIIKRPAVGVMVYVWLSLMNPHRLAYGAAYDFPFAAIVAGLTIVSVFLSKDPKRFPIKNTTVLLLIFIFWITVTSFFALQPTLVWTEWTIVIKTMLMVVVSITALNTERDVRQFAWVIALSLGFWGVKGGIFTLMTGGGDHVYGPPDSFITDNNDLALALLTTLPLIWGLQMQSSKKWLKLALLLVCILTAISIVGSYSRGALVGGSAMLFMLWLKSRHKISTGLVVLLMIPLVYLIMPEQWFARMGTIDAYHQDASALGRINAWHFAVNIAASHIMGGGFKVFTPDIFRLYAPDPNDFHVAHSIYFQALGEQGPIGLVIYLILMIFTWRCGSRILKYCKDKPELKWAADLASMAQVSVIGFAVGGAFLSLTYFDLYYYIIVLLVVLEKCVIKPKPTSFSLISPPVNIDEPAPTQKNSMP